MEVQSWGLSGCLAQQMCVVVEVPVLWGMVQLQMVVGARPVMRKLVHGRLLCLVVQLYGLW